MIIKFNDNTELEVIKVQNRQAYIQNANREVYDFHFDPSLITFEQLEGIFGDEQKTKKIYLINGDDTFLHEDYSIRISLSYQPVEITPETPDAPAQSENRFIVSMARKTYMEKIISQLLGQ